MNDTYDNDSEQYPCIVYAQKWPDPSISVFVVVPFASLYLAVFVLGVVGNLALIHVTLQHRALQTVQNMFILNLAASDIIVCLLSLPITPVTNIYKNWFFGTVLCRLIPWVQGISVFICTFSLGAIAIDRYVLVVRPHSRPLTRRGALIVTMCLWTLSVVVTLPYAVFMEVVAYPGVCGEFCTERWPNSHSRRAYTLMVLAAQFVVPFILMAYCYWTIFSRLRDRARTRLRKINERSHALEQSVCGEEGVALNGNNNGRSVQVTTWLEHQESERHRLLAQTRRTTSILASMVLIFGLSWLPHNVVSLIMEYDANFFTFGGGPDLAYLINLFTHSIAMMNNVANPVLYAWLNPTFREMVMRTFASMGSGGRTRLTSYENGSLINSNTTRSRTRMTTGGGEETRAAAERAVYRAAITNSTMSNSTATNGHATKANNNNGLDSNDSAIVAAATKEAAIPVGTANDGETDKSAINSESTALIDTSAENSARTELIPTGSVTWNATSAQNGTSLPFKTTVHTRTSMPGDPTDPRIPVQRPASKSVTEIWSQNGDILHWNNHIAASENKF